MNNRNKNYRIMKFLEPVGKLDRAKGYVRLDMRGMRGSIIVSVENIGDQRTASEVYLFKNRNDKIKVGLVNNRKGMVKKNLMFGNQDVSVEDYNICGIVKDDKIIMYAPLFTDTTVSEVKKLDEGVQAESVESEIQDSDAVESSDELSEPVAAEEMEVAEDEVETIAPVQDLEPVIEEEAAVTPETEQYAQLEPEDVMAKNIEEQTKGNDSAVPEAVDTGESQDIDEAGETEVHIEENLPESEDIKEEELPDDEGETEQEIQSLRMGKGKKKYKNEFEENLYVVLEGYEKINPLSVNIKNLSWWAVRYDEKGINKGFLPYYNQVISTYYPYPMSNRVTTCQSLMKKYGYYIFGVYKEGGEIKKFVYGVPGEFRRDEQPYKGVTGFKNWSYKNKDIRGDYGYWLAFVDSKTGDVTDPPKIDMDK